MANQILRDRLIAWAEEQARSNKQPVEQPLIDLLIQNLDDELGAYKTDELRDFVRQLCVEGTKGYKQMARNELLNEIDEEMADPDLYEGTTDEAIADEFADIYLTDE